MKDVAQGYLHLPPSPSQSALINISNSASVQLRVFWENDIPTQKEAEEDEEKEERRSKAALAITVPRPCPVISLIINELHCGEREKKKQNLKEPNKSDELRVVVTRKERTTMMMIGKTKTKIVDSSKLDSL